MARTLLIASLLLSFLAVAASPASADPGGEPAMTASGELLPRNLPRERFAPAALRVGFTSAAVDGSGSPQLAGIAIDLSPMVRFEAAGLPSCPLAALYAPGGSARQVCAGSLVGAGSVVAEIAAPGQPPAAAVGSLLAFYAQGGGKPRVLAQVVTADPIPLTYVIPFAIVDSGASGVSLVTIRIDQPYSRIESLKMSLRRLLAARCSAPGRRPAALLPLGRVGLSYADGSVLSKTLVQPCVVSGA